MKPFFFQHRFYISIIILENVSKTKLDFLLLQNTHYGTLFVGENLSFNVLLRKSLNSSNFFNFEATEKLRISMDSQIHFVAFIFFASTCESPLKKWKNVVYVARRFFFCHTLYFASKMLLWCTFSKLWTFCKDLE